MSQEDVEIVRGYLATLDGEDVVPLMREFVETLGPHFQTDAVLAYLARDPTFQYIHPDIEWDIRAGGLSTTAHGQKALAVWWADLTEVWESYIVRSVEYRDLGDWVLVPIDAFALGRGGIAVELRHFTLYQVRDGKIAVSRSYRTEHKALQAAGVAE